MSLISLRNLAGPFRSKLQMGALAIAVILVLVIRLGTSRSGDGHEATARGTAKAGLGSQDLLRVLDEAAAPGNNKSRRSAQVGDELLEGLVAEGIDSESADQQRAQPAKNEDLEDIRKSLGLE
jgi:hypothetical protein